jgi:hypothetical protein
LKEREDVKQDVILLHVCLYFMVFFVVLTPLLAGIKHRPWVCSVHSLVCYSCAEVINDGMPSFACFVGPAMRYLSVLGYDKVVRIGTMLLLGYVNESVLHIIGV